MLRIFLTSFIFTAAASAQACEFCTPVVFLNDARAACFLNIYAERLERLTQNGRGFVEVDLESCITGGAARKKSVVQSPRDPDFDGGARIYLDAFHMACIRQIILDSPDEFDPQRTLALTDLCPKVATQ